MIRKVCVAVGPGNESEIVNERGTARGEKLVREEDPEAVQKIAKRKENVRGRVTGKV